jgi:histidine triad (HIT) family protein
MSGCVFCDIVAGREAASRVYEDDATLAFMNLRQANAGHVLVVPKTHLVTLDQLTPDIAARLFQAVVLVARAVQRCFGPDGLNIWQSNGVAAGQDVFHVHVHVFPRWAGDGFLSVYPELPACEERATLDRLAGQLRAAIPSPG